MISVVVGTLGFSILYFALVYWALTTSKKKEEKHFNYIGVDVYNREQLLSMQEPINRGIKNDSNRTK